MNVIFRKAHELTKKIKKEFPEVNYRAQFSIYLSYLLVKEGNKSMDRINALIKKFKFEVFEKDNQDFLKTNVRATKNEAAEIKQFKKEIISEIKKQDEEEFYKMQLEEEQTMKKALELEEIRLKNTKTYKKVCVQSRIEKDERFKLNDGTTWSNGNVYAYGECIGTLSREDALKNKYI